MAIHFPGAWIINVLFFSMGLFYLVRAGLRCLRKSGRNFTSLSILAVAAVTALPALFTPLDWDRYYLYPVVFVSLVMAVGVGVGITAARRRVQLLGSSVFQTMKNDPSSAQPDDHLFHS